VVENKPLTLQVADYALSWSATDPTYQAFFDRVPVCEIRAICGSKSGVQARNLRNLPVETSNSGLQLSLWCISI
jgi:hypothetical protein